MLANKNEIIEGATSGIISSFILIIEIFSWFGINMFTITEQKIKLKDLMPALKPYKLSELVGATKIIGALLKNVRRRRRIIVTTPDLEAIPLQEIPDNECPLEVFVEPLNFKDNVEAYIIRLSFPKQTLTEINIKEIKTRTAFAYDARRHAYLRAYEQPFKLNRSDMGRSMFFSKSEASQRANVVFYRRLFKGLFSK